MFTHRPSPPWWPALVLPIPVMVWRTQGVPVLWPLDTSRAPRTRTPPASQTCRILAILFVSRHLHTDSVLTCHGKNIFINSNVGIGDWRNVAEKENLVENHFISQSSLRQTGEVIILHGGRLVQVTHWSIRWTSATLLLIERCTLTGKCYFICIIVRNKH